MQGIAVKPCRSRAHIGCQGLIVAPGKSEAEKSAASLRNDQKTCVPRRSFCLVLWWCCYAWRTPPTNPVQPHMRGEHCLRPPVESSSSGSSPHAWGTPPSPSMPCTPPWFIPTCVGNTPLQCSTAWPFLVHPHMRGEHINHPAYPGPRRGSSPHAWGTLPLAAVEHRYCRFIPTCVGNTAMCVAGQAGLSVHPHMRGEHLLRQGWIALDLGSSPHAWGTLPTPLASFAASRFIPTCVGNTGRGTVGARCVPVHPHMRGEHSASSFGIVVSYGSSPHAWGTHSQNHSAVSYYRFIPTCVGNTSLRRPALASASVHPHMRGEHSVYGCPCGQCVGSSPHAWGTL